MQTYFVKFMGARGLADTEIGIASSIATVVPIVAVPFWARLADRARYKNALLALSTVAPALIALLFLPDLEIPAIFLGTVALFHFFACPHDMYSNAITLEYLSANNRPFGRVRLMGTAGWAVSGLVTRMDFRQKYRFICSVLCGRSLSATSNPVLCASW